MPRRACHAPRWIDHLLCVVLVILVTGAVAGCGTPDSQVRLAPTAVQRPALPPIEIVPTVTPAATDIPRPSPTPPDPSIPPCTFAAPSAQSPADMPVQYNFSEPEIILRNPGAAIGIASWLPDNRRLLITPEMADTPRETIETLDIRTGQRQVYAERHALTGNPVWLEPQQDVAFVDAVPDTIWELRRATTPLPAAVQVPLASPHLAVDPTGQRVGVLLRAQRARPALIGTTTQTVQSVPDALPVAPWQHDPTRPLGIDEIYRLTWSPQGTWIAYTSIDGLYLHNTGTEALCRIALEGPLWAVEVAWSPDERRLALRVAAQGLPTQLIRLWILDMQTGDMQEISPPASNKEWGISSFAGITWAPDSRSLAALARVRRDERGVGHDGLFLIDIEQNTATRVLPDFEFVRNMHWSGDGQYMVIDCSVWEEGRVCLMEVTPVQ